MNKALLFGGIGFLLIGFFLVTSNKPQETQTPAATLNYGTEEESSDAASPSGQVAGETNQNNLETMTQAPAIQIDKTKKYQATLHTSEGDIVVDLSADKTPITVNNFVSLAKKNFYNNTIFHRVIKGFMIQGGDPEGTGAGGPGYEFNDEPFEGEYTRGTIAMANAGPNTNGSQFFIMHADYALPKNYVIFGKVASGLDVVDKIATAPTSESGMGENSKPVTPVKVTSVDIVEK